MQPQDEFKQQAKQIFHQFVLLLSLFGIVIFGVIYYATTTHISNESSYTNITLEDNDRIENGIHVATGLIEADGLTTVINNCTNCHSAQLVIQNRMDETRWNSTIKWMQETQNLWDLGDNQKIIVDYLITNYPALEVGRRAPLTDVEWYVLKN